MTDSPRAGTIGWIDLTLANAHAARDFYRAVVGWEYEEVAVGDHTDYIMKAGAEGVPVAGICNARGQNAGLPACWLMYITVDDLAAALKRVEQTGGRILRPSAQTGGGTFAVIADPSGAACALFQHTPA
jgi:predicted enzyme related to lactoylglutathione lyase